APGERRPVGSGRRHRGPLCPLVAPRGRVALDRPRSRRPDLRGAPLASGAERPEGPCPPARSTPRSTLMKAARALPATLVASALSLGCALGTLETAPARSAGAGPSVLRNGHAVAPERCALLQEGDVIATPPGTVTGIGFGRSADVILLENTQVTL